MDGADLRAFRQRWNLSQTQVASCLTALSSDGRRYWQQQVSQFERTPPSSGKSGRSSDWRPIPDRPRELGSSGVFDPSVREELERLIALPEDQMRDLRDDLFGPTPKGGGAYRPRA